MPTIVSLIHYNCIIEYLIPTNTYHTCFKYNKQIHSIKAFYVTGAIMSVNEIKTMKKRWPSSEREK